MFARSKPFNGMGMINTTPQTHIQTKTRKAEEGEVLDYVIFEERLNGKFSEIAVEFYFEGSRANLENPENFSGNLPDSPDSTRFRKLKAKIPL